MNSPLAFYQSLKSCEIAAQSCVDSSDSALNELRMGLKDVKRFKKVSQFDRHFILISESEVANAKSQLASDIEPQIKALTNRAEVALNELKKKESQLNYKAEKRQSLAHKAKSKLSAEDAGKLQRLSLQKERYEIQIKDEENQLKELEDKLKLLNEEDNEIFN